MSTNVTYPPLKVSRISDPTYPLLPDDQLPAYQTEGSACFDLYAHHAIVDTRTITYNFTKHPHQLSYLRINTGLAFEVPEGYAMLVFVRSSIGMRGLTLINGTGIIDSDYRGEVLVNLQVARTAAVREHEERALSDIAIWLNDTHPRVAQAMLVPAPQVKIIEVPYDSLSKTDRGTGGFGSTGR